MDAVFLYSHKNSIGVFVKADPTEVYPSSLNTWMKFAGTQGFPGFSLSIFDIPGTIVSSYIIIPNYKKSSSPTKEEAWTLSINF